MQEKIQKTRMSEKRQWMIAIAIGLSFTHLGSQAADMGDTLCQLSDILTGKPLFGIMFVAVIGGGAGVLFGGEMNDFLKIIAKIVFVIGLILGFGQLGTVMFKAFGKATC